jgi:hypothetical protein
MLDAIKHVNNHLLSLISEDENEYFSFDSVCQLDENKEIQSQCFTTEFLNDIKFT